MLSPRKATDPSAADARNRRLAGLETMKTLRGNPSGALLALAVGASLLAGCGGGGGGGSTASVPKITTQPTAQTATSGSDVTFSVVASGKSLTYAWHFVAGDATDTAVTGGTGSTLTLTSVSTASAGSYYVIVTNTAGSVKSSVVTLTVSASGNAGVTID